jgi:hypothetical protein
MWDSLKESHSWQMLANAYVEFKGILDTRIPEDQSPAITLAKIQAHIEQLSDFHINLDEYIYFSARTLTTYHYYLLKRSCSANPFFSPDRSSQPQQLLYHKIFQS